MKKYIAAKQDLFNTRAEAHKMNWSDDDLLVVLDITKKKDRDDVEALDTTQLKETLVRERYEHEAFVAMADEASVRDRNRIDDLAHQLDALKQRMGQVSDSLNELLA